MAHVTSIPLFASQISQHLWHTRHCRGQCKGVGSWHVLGNKMAIISWKDMLAYKFNADSLTHLSAVNIVMVPEPISKARLKHLCHSKMPKNLFYSHLCLDTHIWSFNSKPHGPCISTREGWEARACCNSHPLAVFEFSFGMWDHPILAVNCSLHFSGRFYPWKTAKQRFHLEETNKVPANTANSQHLHQSQAASLPFS